MSGKADARTFGQDLMRGEHRVANDYTPATPVERLAAPRLAPDLLDLCGAPRPAANDNSLRGRYMAPPFSVLDTKTGEWQARKREWLALGIRSELGRGEVSGGAELIGNGMAMNSKARDDAQRRLADRTSNLTGAPPLPAWAQAGTGTERIAPGTSIFDPVLTEICLSWFCPAGGVVLDPFAGGSVRGVVAAKMGLSYQGFELRAEQVAANREQAEKICPDGGASWVVGDSAVTIPASSVAADMVFTCPPYGALEVYSNDPADISNMTQEDFSARYTEIIGAACAKLRADRFAAAVVGNYRDKRGLYHDLVGLTVQAFEAAGLGYYNDIVLLNAIGSGAVRAGKQFTSGRKVVKIHQNVLVFVKGDWRRAAAAVRGGA